MADNYIAVHVTPRSRTVGLTVEGNGVRVYVAAVPNKGAANKALIVLLADGLGVAPSALRIVSGATARRKLVAIEGMEVWEALDRLRKATQRT